MMIPYEIHVIEPDGRAYILAHAFADEVLSDADAKTAAIELLQAIITKIQTPSPDVLAVVRGLSTPEPYHIRAWRQQKTLE